MTKVESTTIIKADGSAEIFRPEKLSTSLERSGADQRTIKNILTHISTELSNGMTTESIYKHARSLLRKEQKVVAARYSLRRALFGLGPTGFPFEKFLAHLFEYDGYTTRTGVMLKGKCISHEIDLVAYKEERCFIAEAKFHSRNGVKSDAQVALYSYARFLDLVGKNTALTRKFDCPVTETFIITNTKFTKTAVEYAECVGMELLSWNYPKGNTLQDRIEKIGVYPITVLSSISQKEKKMLLRNNIVLCRDMAQKQDVLRSLGLKQEKIDRVIKESADICAGI